MKNTRVPASTICLVLLLCLCAAPPATAQPPSADPRLDGVAPLDLSAPDAAPPATSGWLQTHGSETDPSPPWPWDTGEGVAVDPARFVYVAGSTEGDLGGQTNAGDRDAFVAKFDWTGVQQWARLLGSPQEDRAYGVAISPVGQVYVAGYTTGDLNGQDNTGEGGDLFVALYDQLGARAWTRLLGVGIGYGTYENYDVGIAADAAGNAYVTALGVPGACGPSDCIVLAKYDTNGVQEWLKFLDASQNTVSTSIALDSSGNLYVAGFSLGDVDGEANAGGQDVLVAKFDNNGDKVWVRLLGTAEDEYGTGIGVDQDANVYVTGYTFGNLGGQTNTGQTDAFVAKYDTAGTQQWVRLLGTSDVEWARDLTVDSANMIYITGDGPPELGGYASPYGYNDLFVAQYDTAGNLQWLDAYGTQVTDVGKGVAVDSGGRIYAGGSTYDYNDILLWQLGEIAGRVIRYTFDQGDARNWQDDGSGTWGVTWVQDTASARPTAPELAKPQANGVYQMAGDESHSVRYSYFNHTLSDFCFQADARKVAGDSEQYNNAYGLRFRSDGSNSNFYAFYVSRAGWYWIGKRVDGIYATLVDWTPLPVLKTGFDQWNTLKVCARGEKLTYYANSTYITSIKDTSLTSGQPGFYAFDASDSDAPDTVQFDNAIFDTGQKLKSYLPLVVKGK